MSRREQGSFWTGWIGLSLVIVMLPPMLYVLSIGPACWLAGREIIYGDNHYLFGFYLPITHAAESCPPFGQFMAWYQSFWVR